MEIDLEQANDSDEEIFVYAEFKDSVNIDNYRSIHILGINERSPIMQLDETIFTGNLESPLGTYMFFTKDPTPQHADELFEKLPIENVKYLCKANKYLNMSHTYITPKSGTDQAASSHPQEPEKEPVPMTFNTVQEALEKFTTEWQYKLQDSKTDIKDNLPNGQDMVDLDKDS